MRIETKEEFRKLRVRSGIYGAEMVSKITDKILPESREWQSRHLNPVYPFVFIDCIRYMR